MKVAEFEYGWRKGPHPGSSTDPRVVGLLFEKLEAEHGRLDAGIVVEAARPKDSPIHDAIFHVGKAEAAALHYAERARGLMRALTVRVVQAPTTEPVRARVALARDGDTQYWSAEAISADPELTELHRNILLRKLSALRLELLQWDEFAAVVAAIEEVERREAA